MQDHKKPVKFYDVSTVEDRLLKYAVIAARYQGKWIFCRHRERCTWEIPGGHREAGEEILQTAKRELYEETEAKDFTLQPVCVYSLNNYGLVYFAEVKTLGPLPELEIECIQLFDTLPDALTYPNVHPFLFKRVMEKLNE